jgi:hypothetical protein
MIAGVLYLALAAGLVLVGVAFLQRSGSAGLILILFGALSGFIGWRLIKQARRLASRERPEEPPE